MQLNQRSRHTPKKKITMRQRGHLTTLIKRARLITDQKQGLLKQVLKTAKIQTKKRNQTPSGGEEQRRDMN
jgi:hypothetical protein